MSISGSISSLQLISWSDSSASCSSLIAAAPQLEWFSVLADIGWALSALAGRLDFLSFIGSIWMKSIIKGKCLKDKERKMETFLNARDSRVFSKENLSAKFHLFKSKRPRIALRLLRRRGPKELPNDSLK